VLKTAPDLFILLKNLLLIKILLKENWNSLSLLIFSLLFLLGIKVNVIFLQGRLRTQSNFL